MSILSRLQQLGGTLASSARQTVEDTSTLATRLKDYVLKEPDQEKLRKDQEVALAKRNPVQVQKAKEAEVYRAGASKIVTGATTLAKDIVRAPQRAAVSTVLSAKGEKDFTPGTGIAPRLEKLLLGEEKVKSVRGTGESTVKGFGGSEATAKMIGLPVGIGLTALDLIPGTPKKKIAQEAGEFVAEKYVKELIEKQAMARKPAIFSSIGDVYKKSKTAWIDSTSAIEDAITKSQKKFGIESLPEYNIRSQIDRVKRSSALSENYIKQNGLEGVIQSLPTDRELQEASQYMIAKQARTVASKEINTGRDLAKDELLIQSLAPKYEEIAQKTNAYSRRLLQDSVDSGLVSQELADSLVKEYPEYVPMNRVFNEIEQRALGSNVSASTASLGKQTAVQRLKGSTREIEDPLASLISKTHTVVNQIEKNKAAGIIINNANLPGNPLGLVKLGNGVSKQAGQETISVFKNGIKEDWLVDPDIARAAKSLDAEQIGLLGRIIAVPVRVLKVGATGLSLPFIGANLVKDQLFTLVTGKYGRHTINPMKFLEATFDAVGHGKGYQELVSNAGLSTSFDISRNAATRNVKSIQSGRSFGSRIKYLAKNPAEAFRALEDIFGRTEELTRLQQAKIAEANALAIGRTAKDAKLLGAEAARENTANFSRSGTMGKVFNTILPYFNASIQGSRTLVRALKKNPVTTSAKIAATLYFPMATLTAYNLSSDEKRKVYNDLAESEKDGNLIFIPDNPTKDKDGKWNVIKIPLTAGYSQLAIPIRKGIEQYMGGDSIKAQDFAQALIGSISPVNVDIREKNIAGQIAIGLTPQAIKPTLESTLNVKTYPAGANIPIVPRGLEKLPPEMQVKENTSATSRVLGKWINTSPLKVQQFINSTFAEVGKTALHYSDKVIQKIKNLPEEQVSGEGIATSITRRFNKAQGGEYERKYYDDTNNVTIEKNALKKRFVEAMMNGRDEDIDNIVIEISKHNSESLDIVIKGFENGSFKPKDQKEMKSEMISYTIEQDELKEALKKAIAEMK